MCHICAHLGDFGRCLSLRDRFVKQTVLLRLLVLCFFLDAALYLRGCAISARIVLRIGDHCTFLLLFDLLCFFLKNRADSLGIVPKLLATSTEIEQFLTDDTYEANFLKGWRWNHFGKEAKGLKEGTRGLIFDKYLKTIAF